MKSIAYYLYVVLISVLEFTIMVFVMPITLLFLINLWAQEGRDSLSKIRGNGVTSDRGREEGGSDAET